MRLTATCSRPWRWLAQALALMVVAACGGGEDTPLDAPAADALAVDAPDANALDAPAAPTDILLTSASIAEDAAVGALVGSLATDHPSTADVFTLVAGTGGDDNDAFTIVGGELRTGRTLDFETKPSYAIRVRVTDALAQTFEKALAVGVLDVDEQVAMNDVLDDVLEDSAPSTIDVLANDVDTDGGTMSIATVTQPAHGTVVRASDGSVVTYEPAPDFAGDDGFTYTLNSGAQASVTVHVLTVNDAPSFTKGANVVVDEDAGATTVSWASAIAAGPADEVTQAVTFSVTDNTNAALFAAAPAISSTGTLTFTPAANASGQATITIALADDGGVTNGGADTSAAETFTITVTPVNDPPTNVALAGSRVAENRQAGAIVGSLAAIDPDGALGDTISFALASGVAGCDDTGNASFQIVGTELRTAALLDHESQPTVTICVRTTDAGGASSHTPMTISVLDRVELTASTAHTCEIRTDRTLWCWGVDSYGQLGNGAADAQALPVQIGTASNWASVSSTAVHTCATRTDGTLWCWGSDGYGQLGNGAASSQSAPAQIGTETTWTTVSAGQVHTCATRTDGTLWCWGADHNGQLGNGAAGAELAPVQIGPATSWANVSAGSVSTCATRDDGTLWCWGGDSWGELGNGATTGNQTTPFQVGLASTWVDVSAGAHHACATRSDNTLWCWGNDADGQVGNGATVGVQTSPVQIGATSWRRVSAGASHTCATRTDGTLWCWGKDDQGELGNAGTSAPQVSPVQVGAATTWATVTSGTDHTCATRTDGTLWCWGRNSTGQLGNGTTGSEIAPVQVGSSTSWNRLALGTAHTCATRTDGTLWCWGTNGDGRLGNSNYGEEDSPVQVGTGTTWATITAGDGHTCATRTDGTLWCWGDDYAGELGNGDAEGTKITPFQVGVASTWASVAAGRDHTCAVGTDGTLWCWGYGGDYRLGNGDTANRTSPTQVGSDTTWANVAAGHAHSCATTTGRSLWCWGNDYYGTLGNGAGSTSQSAPAQVGVDATWDELSSGAYHNCATRTGGDLACWGYGASGQLGLGEGVNVNQVSPMSVGALWSAVATGRDHTCAVRLDGTLWCWGSNVEGQLGDGHAWAIAPALVH